MTWEIIFILALLTFAVISFVLEKIPTDLTAITLFSSLLLVGTLDLSAKLPTASELLSVFSNPAPITIAAMFIISAAMEKTGLIDQLTRYFDQLKSLAYYQVIIILTIVIAFVSAFINNTPVVVIMMPVILSLSRKMNIPASKLLIPLSYASIMGGSCTLIGTSTNILASHTITHAGLPALSMFELAKIGLPLLFVGIIYLAIFGKYLLPVRETLTSILSEEERKEFLTEAFVKAGSSLLECPLKETQLYKTQGIRVLEIIRNGVALPGSLPETVLQTGDRLVLSCRANSIVQAHSVDGVDFIGEKQLGLEQITAHEGSIIEGVIGPQSTITGKTLQEINFRQRYRMIVLAIHRRGRNVRNKMNTLRLEFGDTLLMMGTDIAIRNLRRNEDIILLDHDPLPAQNLKKKGPIALLTILGIIGAVSFNVLPIISAAIIGVTLLLLTGCLKPKEGYAAVDWSILLLIYGTLGLGIAMQKTGTSNLIASSMVQFIDYFSSDAAKPYLILAGIYFMTWILTEMLSNNATIVLMAPIAIGLAEQLQIDSRPLIIATCIAASTTFSSPIGYQTNTYVYSVGGYKFNDFFKIGIPLNLTFFVLSSLLIPLLWPF